MKTKLQILRGRITQPTVIRVPDVNPWRDIEAKICREFGVTSKDLHSRGKPQRVAYARFLLMDLIRRVCGTRSIKAGRYLNMHHSSALYAKIRVQEMTETDPIFRAHRKAVERAL